MIDRDKKPGASDDEVTMTRTYTMVRLLPRFPFELRVWLPFSKSFLKLGGQNLASRRRLTKQRPGDPNAHVQLGALLISQNPVTKELAEEAATHFRSALDLVSAGGNLESYSGNWRAMVHLFLGDALLLLGDVPEARAEWKLAVDHDPVKAAFSYGGTAAERLSEHPDADGT